MPNHPDHDLDNLFTHHVPFDDQGERYTKMRAAAKVFAAVVVELAPSSSERSTAIRKLREVMMWANAAIACNETEGGSQEVPDEGT